MLTVAGVLSCTTGVALCLYLLAWRIANPELTEVQAFLDQWPLCIAALTLTLAGWAAAERGS